MITDAVLWINHPDLMLKRVCGMTVIERQLFTLARAGIRRVWVASVRPPQAERLRLPEALEVHWVEREGDGPVECRPPYIGFSGDHFVRKETLEELLAQEYPRHVSFQDSDKKGVVQVVPFRGERILQFDKRPMPEGSWARVPATADRSACVDWILAGARKGHDGFMARVFDRHLSLAVTRRLLDTWVQPNHMTVFSSLIGAVGAIQFATPGYAAGLVGAVLVWLHTVLDGCDGELARLRFQESRFGGTLDFWADNVIHFLLFASLGVGIWRGGGGAWALALGFLAAFSSLASAFLAFKLCSKPKRESDPVFKGLELAATTSSTERALQRVENLLAQRDFIYLLVLAAAFQKLPLFVLAAGIGAPLFLIILLYLTRQGGAQQYSEAKTPEAAPTHSIPRGPNP